MIEEFIERESCNFEAIPTMAILSLSLSLSLSLFGKSDTMWLQTITRRT